MKRIFQLALIILLGTITFLSCKKTSDPAPTKTIEQLLTANAWKLEEARFLQNNVMTYYKRGVTSNGGTYDVDSIRFNSNNTGTYHNSGGTNSFNWSFTDAEKTKLQLSFNSGGFIVNWENVFVAESTFRYSEYFTIPNSSTISEGADYRTPR